MHPLPWTAVVAVFAAALTLAPGAAGAEPRTKKLAVMPLEVLGVDGRIGRLLDYAITFEASVRGDYEVVSAQEIAALIGMEKLRDVLGCDTVACAAEIGGAIDADLMISGSVGKLGSRLSINLILFDVRRMRTKGRVRKEVADDEDLLKGAATAALVHLLGEAPALVSEPLAKAPAPAPEPARQEPVIAKPVLPRVVEPTPAPTPKLAVPEAPPNEASQPDLAVASAPPAESVQQVASSPGRPLAWTAVAVSALAAGAGSYFAMQANGFKKSAEDINNNSSRYRYPDVVAEIDGFEKNRTLAYVSFATAAATAVGAVVLFTVGGKDTPEMVPVISDDGGIGVQWRLSW